MKFSSATILAVATCGILLNNANEHGAHAFTSMSSRVRTPAKTTTFVARKSTSIQQQQHHTALFASTTDEKISEAQRLKERAALLRAEAESAQAEQMQRFAQYTQKAFDKFDKNKDGDINLEELKAGLEKIFKLTEPIPEERVQKIMDALDTNEDGALQVEEFGSIENVRNKLESIALEERRAARELKKAAIAEKEAQDLAQAQLAILNDGEPTNTDKIVSVLPYLFPLLESLQYAGPLVTSHPDNPVAQAVAIVYTLYRSIPFVPFLTLLSFSFLSSNPSFNRQVRFNLSQAITLDVALLFPGVLATAGAFVANGLGADLSGLAGPAEVASDALLASMLATVAYASVSSLLGQTPNKIPLISDRVEKRMLSANMFDENGRFVGLPSNMDDDDMNDNTKQN